ncbi:hypothetical protein ACIBG8_04410 [Nonomuraea sp. NPDC050556]|uniref:hypothetical protein n=1 Tax=Nonomuraea sp. NPDC050556 TaxID=3364369 RepID=UPI0037B0BB0C
MRPLSRLLAVVAVGCAVSLAAYAALSIGPPHREVTAQVRPDHQRDVPKGMIADVTWTDGNGERHTAERRPPRLPGPGRRRR